MDIATVGGLLGCAAAVVYGIVSGDQGFAALGNFWDMPSFLIVVVGALMCMLIQSDGIGGWVASLKSFMIGVKPPTYDIAEVIHKIIDLANVARKEGLLQLEEAAGDIDNEFMKKGIMLIVDGTDQELVSSILESEIGAINARHSQKCGFWEAFAGMGPAWGMIGTLIGLINMLKLLDDPSSIGPNMAVALITTLYGSLIANWLCIPMATKLRAINSKEIMMMNIISEGILSIQAGENPRVIEEKLKSFLAPADRGGVGEEEGQGGEG
ncbi:MAG: MotA/TolQ/ExbB proton channel family protein [Eubacterium sp.]|nr:MotA/TolQ/ExbB proton channel family protein [Eubacterium sp.]